MENSWAVKEFFSADLGDVRLNKRLSLLSDRLVKSPVSPINQACRDWAETKAAYRFFGNDRIDPGQITGSHLAATKERCGEYSTILAIQDTTYFNYSQHPHTKGLCTLSRKKGMHRSDMVTLGLVMHSTFAVGTDGLPLGVVDQQVYSRPQRSQHENAKSRSTLNNQLPVEKKDSYRWVRSLENTTQKLGDISSRVVTVCDREADMYDLFLCADQLKAPLLVRANYDRMVNKAARYSEITGEKLWALLRGQPCKATIQVHVPKQANQSARNATCEVRYAGFNMNVPLNHCEGKRKNPSDLGLYAVYVSEPQCPQRYESIDWMLITNIPIQDRAQTLEKVEWYCLRWRIETWHKVLKSGLKVEECRLSTAQRLCRYLAVMSIVAWRIFWLTIVSRVAPQVSCRVLLNNIEQKILSARFGRDDKLGGKAPTLQQSVRWIAQLGGFLARSKDGQPGITHVWRGLKQLAAMSEGAELANKVVGNR